MKRSEFMETQKGHKETTTTVKCQRFISCHQSHFPQVCETFRGAQFVQMVGLCDVLTAAGGEMDFTSWTQRYREQTENQNQNQSLCWVLSSVRGWSELKHINHCWWKSIQSDSDELMCYSFIYITCRLPSSLCDSLLELQRPNETRRYLEETFLWR